MNSQSELSLVKKLTAIASFLPAFQEGKDLSSLADGATNKAENKTV